MRYAVTIQFEIEAESDVKALVSAEKTAELRRALLDDNTRVLFVSETPFGSITIRPIYNHQIPTQNENPLEEKI